MEMLDSYSHAASTVNHGHFTKALLTEQDK